MFLVFDFNSIETIADVGTGAGIPGIVLKIFFPHLKIKLIDSIGKKIKFLEKVITCLKLKDIEAIEERAEELTIKTEAVISRAMGSISYVSEVTNKISEKYLILMRGKKEPISDNMLKELNYEIKTIKEVKIPIEEADRAIIVLEKNKTNNKYPRLNKEIKKQEL